MSNVPTGRVRAKRPDVRRGNHRKPTPEQAEATRKERVKRCTLRIVERFERGYLPAALAPIFIHRADDVPCRRWSWRNQLLTALAGFDDARTFLEWKKVGRFPRKGETAFYILEPVKSKITRKDADTGEERDAVILRGFKPGARFGYEQTDGADLPERAQERQFLDALPLVEVARAWGLRVGTYNGAPGKALGWYQHGAAIAVGVENLATWAHELVHAADFRLGTLERKAGQVLSNEVVAELGGAVVLTMTGRPSDADLGGAFAYIRAYCDKHDADLGRTCLHLLDRICNAVALILDTSRELAGQAARASA